MIPPTDEELKRKKSLSKMKSRFRERKKTLISSLILELIGGIVLFISQYGDWDYAHQNAWPIYFTIGLVAILLAVFFTFVTIYRFPKRFPGCFGTCGLCIAMFIGAGIFLSSGINIGVLLYITGIFFGTLGITLPLIFAEMDSS